jgi:hypothetical protein
MPFWIFLLLEYLCYGNGDQGLEVVGDVDFVFIVLGTWLMEFCVGRMWNMTVFDSSKSLITCLLSIRPVCLYLAPEAEGLPRMALMDADVGQRAIRAFRGIRGFFF